jgi:hypothetical protein
MCRNSLILLLALSANNAAVAQSPMPADLNLSLPPELLEHIEFGQPLSDGTEGSLLPPLFVQEKPELSPYGLTGKLITNERQRLEEDKSYLEEIEGAELSIEFRH